MQFQRKEMHFFMQRLAQYLKRQSGGGEGKHLGVFTLIYDPQYRFLYNYSIFMQQYILYYTIYMHHIYYYMYYNILIYINIISILLY